MGRRLRCVTLLLQHGINNINTPDIHGNVLIIAPVFLQDKPLLNKLLEYGADPSVVVNNMINGTALWYIVEANSVRNQYSDIEPLLYANVPESTTRASSKLFATSFPAQLLTAQTVAVYKEDIPSIRAFIESGWFVHETLI